MRLGIFLSIFLFLMSNPVVIAKSKKCSKTLSELSVTHVRPTQMSLGMREVSEKVKEIRPLLKHPKALNKFLREHPVLFVLGPKTIEFPKGEIYLVDRHHHARAYQILQIETVYGTMLADLSGLNIAEFWSELEERSWVYTVDNRGRSHPAISMSKIKTLKELKNDSFRALAGVVRDKGGFKKTNIPFAEFLWAHFFREEGIQIGRTKKDFKAAVKAALKIAHAKKAKDLPGYTAR